MKKRVITTNSIIGPEPPRSRRGRRGRRQPAAKKTKAITISTIVGVVVLLCLAAWGVHAFLNKPIAGNLSGDPNVDAALSELITDKVTVLMLGTDSGGANTDTIMLAMLDCKHKTVNIMSIPRDTRVPSPWGGKGYAKINSVYSAKGLSGIINQVNELTGLPINYYLVLNFEGFRKAIDVLGGVEFNVPMRLKYDDPVQNLHIDLQPGLQRLNGDKAEQLVRARNQYPEADITRTQVQRDFVKAVIKQHATPANILKINDLFSQIEPYVKTNIKVGDALRYAPVLTQVAEEDIRLFILPGRTDGVAYYLSDAKEMEKLAKEVFLTDVKIKIIQTPKPIVGFSPSSAPKNTPTPTPTTTPAPTTTPTPKGDNNGAGAPKHTPAVTPKQTPTSAPTTKPTKAPPQTPTPTTKAPTPAPTPAPTKSAATPHPGDYPDGI